VRGKLFLSKANYLIILVFVIVEIFMIILPFNSLYSVLGQIIVAILILFFFKNRPVFCLVAILSFQINPENLLSGVSSRDSMEIVSNGYFLNAFMASALFLVFFINELLVRPRQIKLLDPTFLFISILIFFSLFWAKSTEFYDTRLLYFLVISFGSHIFIKTINDVKIILFAIVINGIIFAIMAFPALLLYSRENIYSMTLDTNYASLYCLVIVSACILIFFQFDKECNTRLKAVIIFTMVIMSIYILVTLSRTGFVMLSAVLLFFLYQLLRRKGLGWLIFIPISIIMISVIIRFDSLVMSYNALTDRFVEEDINTLNGRTVIAEKYLSHFINSNIFMKVFGNGYYSSFIPPLSPHNSFIGIVSFFGVLGGAVLLRYYIRLFIGIRKSKFRAFQLILFLFLFTSLTLDAFNFMPIVIMLSLVRSLPTVEG